MFRCELHKLDGNERLWRDWRDLLERTRPELRLFGPEWYSIWAQTIGSQKPWTGQIDVAAVYRKEDGRLCGVLPVAHPKIGLLKVNAMGGYYQPWRLILADQSCEFEVGRALGLFLVELGWHVIQLGPWPQSHETHKGMLSALTDVGVYLRRERSYPLAIAELPATWDQYQTEVVGRKFLRKIDYYLRKLEREHDVEIRHYREPSEADTHEMVSALSQVEQRSWLNNDPEGRPRFVSPADKAFWTRLTQLALGSKNHLDCWLIFADGQPISFVFALTAGSTRYVLANSYDVEFSQHSTGSILYRRMIEEGYPRGVTRYDFGTQELHYKQLWGAAYKDKVDTYTMGKNQLVGGMLKAGTTLKALWNGSLWKRSSKVTAGPVGASCASDESSSLSPSFPVPTPVQAGHPSPGLQERINEGVQELVVP